MNKKLIIVISVISLFLIFLVGLNITKRGPAVSEVQTENVSSSSGLFSQAKDYEAKNNLLEAKKIYQRLVAEFPNSGDVMGWQKKIEEINIKLLFSSVITEKSVLYEIKQGDSLFKIASQFNTTVELIKKSNNLQSDTILPGKKIKLWKAPFSVLVDKSQNTLILKTDEEVIKTYVVATGKDNSTPTGNFKITNKLTNPTWFKAGAVIAPGSPENILGTRWMGFNLPGYGIHGTTDPETLGRQVTEGCVRMSNADAEELFAILPLGTEVVIVD